MLIHPQINPIALDFGLLKVHWYGLMYFFGFISFIYLGKHQIKNRPWITINHKILDDTFFYGALGVILGGRLGYILFYQPFYYFSHLNEILAFWHGGMSFHGGFIGVLVSLAWIAKKYSMPWLVLTDFIAPLVPIGLFFGRIGNFINQELWGRPTDLPWGMIFPLTDNLSRHPSQIYESITEGIILFIILWVYSSQPRRVGSISAYFLIFYGLFRFIIEFTREPDNFLGLLLLDFSMGQWLSLPMIFCGLFLLNRSSKN